ncbi:hypothetical protein DOY81_000580 [Sarcophaga bullata]|nr:hypothetical protein DOY81_000580 [Sarcophaga bullata]
MMSYFPRSPFTVTYLIAIIVCANLVSQVENKSVFGIGTRIVGDGLLLKDVLHTPPISLTEEPVIKFNYILVEPITYIKIESDKNVNAVVNFSYEDDLIEGTISSISEQQAGKYTKPEPFEVLIQIYGFSDTMFNVNPAIILNKNQEFDGVLKPKSLNLMQENLNTLDGDGNEDLEDYNDETDDDDTGGNDVDYEDNDFDEDYDKIIEQGQRQEGDFLVYETNQTSATSSEEPSNHSITFYYIDIYFITYVKFTIFEHYLDNPLEKADYVPPVVEYGHISPTTLKAVVTDHHTTSLFVKMQMYGYHPTQLPVDYKPFLSNGQTMLAAAAVAAAASASTFDSATTRPISSLRQLKILMNAQQSTNTQQQQQQQQGPNELGQQISPGNNGPVNCLEQVLKSSISSLSSSPSPSPSQANVADVGNAGNAGNSSHSRSIAHWAIFNLIVIIFVTLVFV